MNHPLRLLVVALAACSHPWRPTADQLAPLPAPPVTGERTIGPLALRARGPESSHPEVQAARARAESHYLDRERVHAETTTFLAFVDAFYQPLTPETKIGFDIAHHELGMLETIAPYSIYGVALAYAKSTERLHLCIYDAGMTGTCDRDQHPRPRTTHALFEIGELAPGIGSLVLHDLGDASDPSWASFAEATRALAHERGLVIDLRDAPGADPRALLPWVGALTGGRGLAPLRAIERPADADRFVAAYRARFTDSGRDPAIWRALLATGEPAAPSTAARTDMPIAIVVGRYCESACELVSRVLETYAGATVIGGVGYSGRLARDEPAMFVLPYSQTSVFFHATRYLLDAEIEAATGPTEEWDALGGDPIEERASPLPAAYPVTDHLTSAIRDVAQRLAQPGGWPRCDTLAPVDLAGSDKLRAVGWLGHCTSGTQDIAVITAVPHSVLQRFLATCPAQVTAYTQFPGRFTLQISGTPTADLLAHIAASELVRYVEVSCVPRQHPT